jgi:hypothetical protein
MVNDANENTPQKDETDQNFGLPGLQRGLGTDYPRSCQGTGQVRTFPFPLHGTGRKAAGAKGFVQMIATYPYSDKAWQYVWKRILISADGCWLWAGSRMGGCYPGVLFDGLVYRPHRMIWEMAHSRPFPKGRVGRHMCDQTMCVRHVISGTHKQNAADRRRVLGGRRRPCAHDEVLAMEQRIGKDILSRTWPELSAIPPEYLSLAEFEIGQGGAA